MNVKSAERESSPPGGIVTTVSAPRLLDLLRKAASEAGFGEDWVSLAKKAGVHERTIRRWREGKHDDPRLSSLEAVAGALGTTVGSLLGDPPPTPERVLAAGEALAVGIPLVADEVAAGHGALPEVPDDRIYWFREDWLRGFGHRNHDRFACIRLGDDVRASSMLPTIPPLSLVLVDRSAREATLDLAR